MPCEDAACEPGHAETSGAGCEEGGEGCWNLPLVNAKEWQKMLRRLEKNSQLSEKNSF